VLEFAPNGKADGREDGYDVTEHYCIMNDTDVPPSGE